MENISAYVWVGMKYRPIEERKPDEFVHVLCGKLGFTLDQLQVKTRKRPIVEARQLIMYTLRKRFPKLALTAIGDMFGGFDHTTVIHSVDAVSNHKDTEPDYAEKLSNLMNVSIVQTS